MIGLGAAVPIGPVNVEIARRALRGGFRAGFALGCGAVSVDVFYVAFSSLSLGTLVTRPIVQWPLAIAGFLFLTYLGVQSLRSVRKHLDADPLAAAVALPSGSTEAARDSELAWRTYRTGVLMTLLNPMTLAFWFVVLPAQGAISKDLHHDLPMICSGVFIGTIGWVIVFAGFLGWLGRWRRNWWLAAADGLGGGMLLILAVAGLWQVWHLNGQSL